MGEVLNETMALISEPRLGTLEGHRAVDVGCRADGECGNIMFSLNYGDTDGLQETFISRTGHPIKNPLLHSPLCVRDAHRHPQAERQSVSLSVGFIATV